MESKLQFGVRLEQAYDTLFNQKHPAGHSKLPHIEEVNTVISLYFDDVAENPSLLPQWLNFQKKCLDSPFEGCKSKSSKNFLYILTGLSGFEPHQNTDLFFSNLQKQGLNLFDLISKELLKEPSKVKAVSYDEDPSKGTLGKIFTQFSKYGNEKLGTNIHYTTDEIMYTNGHVLFRIPKTEKIEGVFNLKGEFNKDSSTPAYKNLKPKDFIFTCSLNREKLFKLYSMVEKLNKTNLSNGILGGVILLVPYRGEGFEAMDKKTLKKLSTEILFNSSMLIELIKSVLKLGFEENLELGVAYASFSPTPNWFSLTLTNNLETFEQSALMMSYNMDSAMLNTRHSRVQINLDTLEFEICEGNGE